MYYTIMIDKIRNNKLRFKTGIIDAGKKTVRFKWGRVTSAACTAIAEKNFSTQCVPDDGRCHRLRGGDMT